jgi:amino acid permease
MNVVSCCSVLSVFFFFIMYILYVRYHGHRNYQKKSISVVTSHNPTTKNEEKKKQKTYRARTDMPRFVCVGWKVGCIEYVEI